MNVTIRFAKINDLSQIMSIENSVQINPWSMALVQSKLESNGIVVAQWKRRVVGYLVVSVVLDEVETLNLAVEKEQQSKGVGTQLLKHIIEHLKQQKIKKIFLEVRRSNLKARNLYEKSGFELISSRKEYYKNNAIKGEDALIYLMNLS